MKVLTTIITEATFLLHNQGIPLRSSAVVITSHEWVLLKRECGCYTLLGCYKFCIPGVKSWTVYLGFISQLWNVSSACSEWWVSPWSDGNHAFRDKASGELVHPLLFKNMRDVWHWWLNRENLEIALFVCVFNYLYMIWILWYRIVII